MAVVAKMFGQLLTILFLDNLVQFSHGGSVLLGWFLLGAILSHLAPKRMRLPLGSNDMRTVSTTS